LAIPSVHDRRVDSRHIDVWCTFFDDVEERALREEYPLLLGDDERDRWSRFVFDKDRRRYLVTRALVRSTLSRYADIAPAHWTFRANAFGRPEIINDSPEARAIAFNVSHTDGLAVLVVTGHTRIGVDTEEIRSRRAPLELADRFFAVEESGALKALPPDLQPRRFFEYWTLKESYLKARSVGLSLPLHKCVFGFPAAGQLGHRIDPTLDDPSTWRFWQFTVAKTHLIAICAERLGSEVPTLRLTRVVPSRTADCTLKIEDSRIDD
jgi:4'-phosphopantetheinyl transferase